MFLQLLVAQMRNQDPANPTDSSEFLAQTAQFTALEKMQQVADQTSQLVALQVAFGASSMVGRTVSYAGPDGDMLSGVVSSVRFEATGPVLQVNGEDVHFAEVQSVGDGTTDLTENTGDDGEPPSTPA
jgi:flagellar basal-body rod modification protein FlgD